jgi:hypothetical protein
MESQTLHRSLTALFGELADGAPETGAFVLNPGDRGLLAGLDALSAGEASATSRGGASVAAHADHLRYGLSLLNRWSAGENPFADADWTVAWRRTAVSDAEWAELRRGLRSEADRWHRTLAQPRDMDESELNGVLGSIVHMAYHFGAIRQIQPRARGPRAEERF